MVDEIFKDAPARTLDFKAYDSETLEIMNNMANYILELFWMKFYNVAKMHFQNKLAKSITSSYRVTLTDFVIQIKDLDYFSKILRDLSGFIRDNHSLALRSENFGEILKVLCASFLPENMKEMYKSQPMIKNIKFLKKYVGNVLDSVSVIIATDSKLLNGVISNREEIALCEMLQREILRHLLLQKDQIGHEILEISIRGNANVKRNDTKISKLLSTIRSLVTEKKDLLEHKAKLEAIIKHKNQVISDLQLQNKQLLLINRKKSEIAQISENLEFDQPPPLLRQPAISDLHNNIPKSPESVLHSEVEKPYEPVVEKPAEPVPYNENVVEKPVPYSEVEKSAEPVPYNENVVNEKPTDEVEVSDLDISQLGSEINQKQTIDEANAFLNGDKQNFPKQELDLMF